MRQNKYKSVPTRLDEDVLKEIARIGFFGESRSDVLRRVLKMHKRGENKLRKPSEIEDKMDSAMRRSA